MAGYASDTSSSSSSSDECYRGYGGHGYSMGYPNQEPTYPHYLHQSNGDSEETGLVDESWSVRDLKHECWRNGLRNFTRLNKGALIRLLNGEPSPPPYNAYQNVTPPSQYGGVVGASETSSYPSGSAGYAPATPDTNEIVDGSWTKRELKHECGRRGLRNFARLTKDCLIRLLNEGERPRPRPALANPYGGSVNAPQTNTHGGSVNASQTNPYGGSVNASQTTTYGGSVNASQTNTYGGSVNASQTNTYGGSVNASQTNSGSVNASQASVSADSSSQRIGGHSDAYASRPAPVGGLSAARLPPVHERAPPTNPYGRAVNAGETSPYSNQGRGYGGHPNVSAPYSNERASHSEENSEFVGGSRPVEAPANTNESPDNDSNSKGSKRSCSDNTCIVCMDNEVNCTLVPCGHHCTCVNCAAEFEQCPVCRRNVDQKIKTYGA